MQTPSSPQIPWLKAAVDGGWSRCWRRVQRLVTRPFGRAGAAPVPAELARDWHWQFKNELPALTGFNVQVQTLLTNVPAPAPDAATVSAILLILDELLTNVIKYAHPGEEPGHRFFHVRLGVEADGVKIHLDDDGIPFDPTVDGTGSEGEGDLELEERSIGGWGLSLVRKTASSMQYQRANGRNQLTVYKRFAAA